MAFVVVVDISQMQMRMILIHTVNLWRSVVFPFHAISMPTLQKSAHFLVGFARSNHNLLISLVIKI